MLNREIDSEQLDKLFELRKHEVHLKKQLPLLISVAPRDGPRKRLTDFERQVSELESFLKIFKKNLEKIEIEKNRIKTTFTANL